MNSLQVVNGYLFIYLFNISPEILLWILGDIRNAGFLSGFVFLFFQINHLLFELDY